MSALPPRRPQLPIYPAPQPEIVLVETSSDLESHIAVAREQTTSVFRSVRDETQKVVSMWINIERRAAGASSARKVFAGDNPEANLSLFGSCQPTSSASSQMTSR